MRPPYGEDFVILGSWLLETFRPATYDADATRSLIALSLVALTAP